MWSSRSQVENPRHAKQLVQTNGESKRQKMKKTSEGAGARTLDLRIKSPLLYQLSYALDPLANCRLSWLREGNKMPDCSVSVKCRRRGSENSFPGSTINAGWCGHEAFSCFLLDSRFDFATGNRTDGSPHSQIDI